MKVYIFMSCDVCGRDDSTIVVSKTKEPLIKNIRSVYECMGLDKYNDKKIFNMALKDGWVVERKVL